MIDLTVCSICLRVRHGSGWFDAESVSEEITSGDGEPFRLHGAVCDECAKGARRKSAPNALTFGSFASLHTADLEHPQAA
jgi:hypothetical protein